ncbi:MAG: LCP family protein [Candidatus Eremiobacteraeota bacterium]|nr:LCP family protein [Candidatus Eremiobacteraeota bacterium]
MSDQSGGKTPIPVVNSLPLPHEPAPGPNPLKVFVASAVAIALIAGAVSFGAYLKHKHGLQNALASLNLAQPDLTEIFGKQKLRVLVLGVDENYTQNDIMYTANSRSDTMLAVNVDLASHQVGIVSIPRDLWVHVPKSGYEKINEAIADAGPMRSEQAVIDNLNFPPFDNYVVLKIDATKNLVNAIGGLDVNVEKDMDYDDSWGHLHIHLKKGPQHLDGEQVVGYIRFRHDPEGDYGRMRRQRQVIGDLVKQLKNPAIFAKLPALIGLVQDNVRTDMTYDKLFYLALALRDETPAMVHTVQLPADEGWTDGQSVLFYDAATGRPIVQKYMVAGFGNEFDPSTVHVIVHNGSGQPGAASAMADYLRQRGFDVVSTGNAATFNNPKTIVTGNDKNVAGEVAKRLPVKDANVTAGSVQGGDIEIVIGRDYRTQ